MVASERVLELENSARSRPTTLRRRGRPGGLEGAPVHTGVLTEVARAVVAREDLDDILRGVAQRLEETVTDSASIWLRDEDRFVLQAIGDGYEQAGRRPGLCGEVAVPVESPDLQAVVGAGGVCVTESAALNVPVLKQLTRSRKLRSCVVVPVLVTGEAIGLLVGARNREEPFTREEIGFLDALGKHVALAIEQAQLHQELQEACDQLREAREALVPEQGPGLQAMASEIAHDILNAVSSIPLYTATLEGEADLSEGEMQHLRMVETAVYEVQEVVRRMRDSFREGDDGAVGGGKDQLVEDTADCGSGGWGDVW